MIYCSSTDCSIRVSHSFFNRFDLITDPHVKVSLTTGLQTKAATLVTYMVTMPLNNTQTIENEHNERHVYETLLDFYVAQMIP